MTGSQAVLILLLALHLPQKGLTLLHYKGMLHCLDTATVSASPCNVLHISHNWPVSCAIN